jgi:hypothetical protein
MADYTNLRVRCRLTPAALPLVRRVTIDAYFWRAVAHEPGHEYLAELAADRCSMFIPHNTRGWPLPVCSAHDRLWSFSCDVKNYSGAVEKFLRVLPRMIEELYECKTQYCEADVPTHHYLYNGGITDINRHGTTYRDANSPTTFWVGYEDGDDEDEEE